MTQSLVINGKEYLQSNTLAARFGYTADYIGKLAREEKILGTQIGRQWFIEPESLSVFLAQSDIAKKLRQDELRIQRKLERQLHQEKNKLATQAAPHRELMALAQATVVVFCGVMLGYLGWVASQENLGMHELASGAEESLAFIAKSITGATPSGSSVSRNFVAASAESVSFQNVIHRDTEEVLVFTSLPQFPQREVIATSTVPQETVSVTHGFSDEVRVVVGEDGSEMIVPVFKDQGAAQQFLLVPVNANDQ